MTLVPALAELHEAHKARRARLWGGAPRYLALVAPAPAEPPEATEAPPEPEPAPKPPALDADVLMLMYAMLTHGPASGGPRPFRQTVRSIIDDVAEDFGFSPMDIRSESRSAELVFARHMAIWHAAKQTELSLPVIGKLFGGRDHTTVIHAIRRMNGLFGKNVRNLGVLPANRKPRAGA